MAWYHPATSCFGAGPEGWLSSPQWVLWNSNHSSLWEALGKGQRQDSGMVLPPPSIYLYFQRHLPSPSACWLFAAHVGHCVIQAMSCVLHPPHPLAGVPSCPTLPLAPALPRLRNQPSSDLVPLGHFLSTLLHLSWQSASRVRKWSVYLFCMPDWQLLEGSLYISFISDSLGLGTEPGPGNTQ